MQLHEVECAIEGILFASGEPVSSDRIAAVLAVDKKLVLDIAERLSDKLSFEHRGIRLVRLGDSLQMCSSPEYADVIRLALEARKPPQLTQTALEILAIVAYFQPVTRAYIDKVRGVDSSYTLSSLCEKGLVEPSGTLDAPGRPHLYRTTDAFLRVFALKSISDLPSLPESEPDEDGISKLQAEIEALQAQKQDNTDDGEQK
jgi:segregation and condensation protein B